MIIHKASSSNKFVSVSSIISINFSHRSMAKKRLQKLCDKKDLKDSKAIEKEHLID